MDTPAELTLTTKDIVFLCLSAVQTVAAIVAAVIAWRTYFNARPRPIRSWRRFYVPFLIAFELYGIAIIVGLIIYIGWVALAVGLIAGVPVASIVLATFLLLEEYRRRRNT